MKKIIMTFLATVGIAVLLPATALAATGKTDISGTVTNGGTPSKVVKGATVTVTCDGTTKTATTNASGTYLVVYNAKKCPSGVTATVSATKGTASGSKHGKVKGDTALLNVAIINVALPELGLVTAAGAAILGGGAFLVVRRRHAGATQE